MASRSKTGITSIILAASRTKVSYLPQLYWPGEVSIERQRNSWR